jgi:hypothetical protein
MQTHACCCAQQHPLQPFQAFDLVYGTSAGGYVQDCIATEETLTLPRLNALMLAKLNMAVQQCIDTLRLVCQGPETADSNRGYRLHTTQLSIWTEFEQEIRQETASVFGNPTNFVQPVLATEHHVVATESGVSARMAENISQAIGTVCHAVFVRGRTYGGRVTRGYLSRRWALYSGNKMRNALLQVAGTNQPLRPHAAHLCQWFVQTSRPTLWKH